MDLAFAGSRVGSPNAPGGIERRSEADPSQAPKPREISRRNARVTQLAAALTKATGVKQDSLDDQLAQAKVQAELDQDEVDNAKQELTRAGAADCNAYRYASE